MNLTIDSQAAIQKRVDGVKQTIIEGKHSPSSGYRKGCRCRRCKEYCRDYLYRRRVAQALAEKARAVREFDSLLGAAC